MAIFGTRRDINTFTGISRELLENVVSQTCGYYKISLTDTKVNVYGEGQNKYFIGPVLINCLIERGDFTFKKESFGIDVDRDVTFRFLKYHLVQANVVPEPGDIIMYNESYYQVDNSNENQLIVGKDNDYAYEQGLGNFGDSYSIILSTHLTSPDVLGIKENRL
jgi:hypothetical protein